MLLRPEQAQWFETYVPRSETVTALEALADTGMVELDADPKLARPLKLVQIRGAVVEFHQLAHRYADFFADIPSVPSPVLKAPDEMAEEAMHYLRSWCSAAEELLMKQLQLETQRQRLILLQEYLNSIDGASSDLTRLAHKSRFLFKGVFACPLAHKLESSICAAVDEFVSGPVHNFYLVADLPANQAIIEKTCRAESCLQVEFPEWLSLDKKLPQTQVANQILDIEVRIQGLTQDLEQRKQEVELSHAIENMKLLAWYADHADELSGDEAFCHITGWTKAEKSKGLQGMLEKKGIRATVRFPKAPEFSKPPVSMLLPAWARPFFLFVEMLGTPGRDEVDPGLLLPLTVSLLFGYMFPDVGHGLLLAAFSALFYRRWPKGRFLIPCGISAALFGVVFGEVFGIEGLLEPLWITPLEDPLMILIPPLVFGVGLMLLGLLLNGIQTFWRGEFGAWLLCDAAVLVMYATACSGILYPEALWGTALGLIWFILGQIYLAQGHKLADLLTNLGALLQSLFELLLNTFSFIRVGAFALAHAALTTAVLQIGEGISNPAVYALFLILGHLLIIAVEGLVVFVQTTRLVLFEFFTRFLKAEGRVFRPLPIPPSSSAGKD